MRPKAQLVDYMTKFPQRCLISGAPNKHGQEPVIDTGITVPEYGRVYITQDALRRLGTLIKLVSKSDLSERNQELEVMLEAAQVVIDRIPEVLEGLTNGISELAVDAINRLAGGPGTGGIDAGVPGDEETAGDAGDTSDGNDESRDPAAAETAA